MSRNHDQSGYDVIVVGSGAGGLATAVTAAYHGLKVLVLEKETHLGGTTAWSGGWLWIPRNPLAKAAGIDEPIEEPLRYLQNEIGERAQDPRVRRFLDAGPAMANFFQQETAVAWVDGNIIPDFHTSQGACAGGRSICAAPFDGRALGPWLDKMRPPLDMVSLWGMGISAGRDMTRFFNWYRAPGNMAYVAKRLGRHVWDLVTRRRGLQLVNGNALVARLLRSALDLGVELRCDAPVTGLIESKGQVCGVRSKEQTFAAKRGVVLAAGGFPHDRQRQSQSFAYFEAYPRHHSAAPASNTGDGLRLGEAQGGHIEAGFRQPAAWAPVSLLPRRDGSLGAYPHLVDRAKPGIIAVGPDGKRFVNEANSYHDYMSALFAAHPQRPESWLIADARARRKFGLGAVKPFPFPDAPHLMSGYLFKAKTREALASKIGLPGDTLGATLDAFNRGASKGEDPAFQRGTTPYNAIQGDAFHAPNPNLRPLDCPPFYAVKIVPGSLGTFAGLRTDSDARVLDADLAPIPGLYAVGNDAASIFGGAYPSGGITLGPAMTFGYLAGRALAGRNELEET